jgi:hypothetical protein
MSDDVFDAAAFYERYYVRHGHAWAINCEDFRDCKVTARWNEKLKDRIKIEDANVVPVRDELL